MPGWAYGAITILGMAAVTALSRGFFLWSKRDLRLPDALQRALQVAPLAAIVAVLAPEIFMTHGALIGTWRDARLPAALAATRCARAAARGTGGVHAAARRPRLVATRKTARRRRALPQLDVVSRLTRRCAAVVMRLCSSGEAFE
jgi:branched-subunit amino acid transport protein